MPTLTANLPSSLPDAPRFLTVAEVAELHRQAIALYGGDDGLRDAGLLESAVASPQQTFGGAFLYPTLAEMASAYWFGLVNNHVFVDGNKRIGLRAADVFLLLNGWDLVLSEADVTDATLRMARGEMKRDELSAFLAQNIHSL